MVEYSLIIVLVAIVLIITLALVGSQVSTVFSQIISGLNLASEPQPVLEMHPDQTLEEWIQACEGSLNTYIDGHRITHVRVDEFTDDDGRQAYQCLVAFDSSNDHVRLGDVFYP